MHSVLAVDKNGNPLGNAITWADNRAKKEAQELRHSALGKKLYAATGTPIHPMSPLVKIAWMREYDTERFKQASKVLVDKELHHSSTYRRVYDRLQHCIGYRFNEYSYHKMGNRCTAICRYNGREASGVGARVHQCRQIEKGLSAIVATAGRIQKFLSAQVMVVWQR